MNNRIGKKWLAVLAALLLLCSVFAGCNVTADESAVTTTTTTVTTDGAPVTTTTTSGTTTTTTAGDNVITVVPNTQTATQGGTTTTTTHGTGTTAIPTGTATSTTRKPSISQQPLFDYDRFYGNSAPAASYTEALQRSQKGQLSGAQDVPGQAPVLSAYRPMQSGKYVHNNDPYFADTNTYVVVDAYGNEAFRVYRGGGYITLEEVAAYVYAFGDVPANYVSSKKTKPTASIWKQYLRLNHAKFSGSTRKYPYEPELPRISGCGGDLTYYEIDIGTTGTDCDPDYPVRTYNNGSSIERGAARIVYARYDRNGNLIIEPDEKFVFYTYNHYNDFQEYLNYYGGWGEMFGNITGGGALSSKYNYNPTPYIQTVRASLLAWQDAA